MTISEFNKEILPAIILGIVYSCIEISIASHIVKPFTYFFIACVIIFEIISFPIEGANFAYLQKSFLIKNFIVTMSVFFIIFTSEYDYENFVKISLINSVFILPKLLFLAMHKSRGY